jgi:hypothetical protein
MVDGIVMMGEKNVGTFEVELDDRIIIKFPDGMSVREMLEYASDNGMPLYLQTTPSFEPVSR